MIVLQIKNGGQVNKKRHIEAHTPHTNTIFIV